MNSVRLWRLFHRRGQHTVAHTSVLSIVAFAAATAIFLTVLGGVHGFIWRASPEHTLSCAFDAGDCAAVSTSSSADQLAGSYVIFALFACTLLVVPFAALAGSAARLVTARRDARLAALRLAGATRSQVIALTAMDAAAQALVGAVLGILGYVALLPAVMLLVFQNQHFTLEQLWVRPWVLLDVVLGVVVLSLVSSMLTLRRVSITPLGVMQRSRQRPLGAWRIVLFLVILVGSVIPFGMLRIIPSSSGLLLLAIVFGCMALCFALFNLIGAWLVSLSAQVAVRRPRSASMLIAMRRVLDNPKRAWRNVSGIALAVFVAGLTSTSAYFSDIADSEGITDPAQVEFIRDIGTGGLLTLGFAAVLAAVSCGVMQAGNVYDQACEYRILRFEGMPTSTMNRARLLEVMIPMTTVIVAAALCSALLMMPLLGSVMTRPLTLVGFLGGIALCFALVAIGVMTSNRVARAVQMQHYRVDD